MHNWYLNTGSLASVPLLFTTFTYISFLSSVKSKAFIWLQKWNWNRYIWGRVCGKWLTTGSRGRGEESLICSVHQFPWYKYYFQGRMNVELENYGYSWLSHMSPAHRWTLQSQISKTSSIQFKAYNKITWFIHFTYSYLLGKASQSSCTVPS